MIIKHTVRMACVVLIVSGSACAADQDPAAKVGESVYTFGAASRDGTGKFYMGREISHVMGHRGASWLERDTRVGEERSDLLIDNLPLTEASVVVDLGAGTGYFSFPMAERSPDGKIIAVDLQPQMLEIIESRMAEDGVTNIQPVLATETNPNLPEASVDVALIVDAYHEFSFPLEVMRQVAQSLKPDGRLYLIEYRAEDPSVPIKPLHKMSEEQAKREMKAAGLGWVETGAFLPRQHVLIFKRL
jgi:SAM-dependent methyltransferase